MKNINLLHNQSGSAMVISLMALMLMTMLGMTIMVGSQTENQIAAHDMRSTQALYNSEAGYAEVLARMNNPEDTTNYIGPEPGDWVTDPGWGCYLVLELGNYLEDPDLAALSSDGLDNDKDGLVDEAMEHYPEVLSKQGADALNYPFVKVHYKLDSTNQVVLFGDHDNDPTTPSRGNLVNGTPIIVVTSRGGRGSASRTVQVEALQPPFQSVTAAVYSESDDFTFNGLKFVVSGEDWDPVTESVIAGNAEVPGIATTEDPAVLASALVLEQEDNVSGIGLDPSVLQSTIDIDLRSMADEYIPKADLVLPPSNYSNVNWGDYDNYNVVYCPGDLQVKGQSIGGGILIVEGNVNFAGQFTWYGLVLVMGNVRVSGGGQGIHIWGSILSQGTVDIGGQTDLLYSSAALAKLATMSPYVVSSWRELR